MTAHTPMQKKHRTIAGNASGFHAFADQWQEHAQLALDTIALKPTRGIPKF